MIRWAVATAPKDEPITLAEARLHLRDPEDAENSRIAANLAAARQHVENVCERAIMPQTWRVVLDDFREHQRRQQGRQDYLLDNPSLRYDPRQLPPQRQAIKLPGGNVHAVSSVKYIDTAGTEQTLDPSAYQLDPSTAPARLLPAPGGSWPQTQCGRVAAVTVDYTCGWAEAAQVPQALKSAILLLLGDLHENREAQIVGTTITTNKAVESLIWPYRLRVLA